LCDKRPQDTSPIAISRETRKSLSALIEPRLSSAADVAHDVDCPSSLTEPFPPQTLIAGMEYLSPADEIWLRTGINPLVDQIYCFAVTDFAFLFFPSFLFLDVGPSMDLIPCWVPATCWNVPKLSSFEGLVKLRRLLPGASPVSLF